MSFEQFIAKEMYAKVHGLGDRLELMKEQIDWKPFIPLVKKVFFDNKTDGGRPHTDELIVVRSILLQSWYTMIVYLFVIFLVFLSRLLTFPQFGK